MGEEDQWNAVPKIKDYEINLKIYLFVPMKQARNFTFTVIHHSLTKTSAFIYVLCIKIQSLLMIILLLNVRLMPLSKFTASTFIYLQMLKLILSAEQISTKLTTLQCTISRIVRTLPYTHSLTECVTASPYFTSH